MKVLLAVICLSFSLVASPNGSIDALNVAGNGMLIQKYRLRTIAENIANVSTHMTDTVVIS